MLNNVNGLDNHESYWLELPVTMYFGGKWVDLSPRKKIIGECEC